MVEFTFNSILQTLLTLFSVVTAGYLLGSIRIRGVGLGTAAIFIAGLVFGHFGGTVPEELQTLGLLMFITATGLNAGPGFLRRLQINGKAYVVLCLAVAAAGSLLCAAIIRIGGLEVSLAVGLMTGAFTTSPGFAAAKEAVSPETVGSLAAGYGVAYPLGVICKVLAIQLIPRLLRADMDKERALIALPNSPGRKDSPEKPRPVSKELLTFSLAALPGLLLGAVAISLPGGGRFALGTTGGPLFTGLLFGHIGRLGKFRLRPDPRFCDCLKEIGLMLFLSGAGLQGGHGGAAIIAEHGAALLLYSLLLVVIPLAAGVFLSLKVLRLPLLNGLGAITASMTSTPSLAVLIETAGTDDVAAAYATTYPIALITLVLVVQLLVQL